MRETLITEAESYLESKFNYKVTESSQPRTYESLGYETGKNGVRTHTVFYQIMVDKPTEHIIQASSKGMIWATFDELLLIHSNRVSMHTVNNLDQFQMKKAEQREDQIMAPRLFQ